MKKLLLSLIFIFSFFGFSSFGQVATHVVIAEIFAGGGNGGAPYFYDYITLYNPTGSPVDVSTWSVQYSSTVFPLSPVWQKVDLTGSIPAGSYYLVQLASAGVNGIPMSYYPDVLNKTISLKKSVGKVALVSNQTLFIADPTLPDASVIDFVGYYDTSNPAQAPVDLYETAPCTIALGDRKGIRRKTNSNATTYNYGSDGSGWDADDNSTDFYSQNDLLLIPNQPLSTSDRANHVVIAEVFGGGGPSGTYRYDYVVLYNSSSDSTYDLSTWSLQYYNGSTWDVENLSGSIAPDVYYLIQLGDGGSGTLLPVTPDLVGTTDIGETDGEVALVNDQMILSGANPLSTDQNIVDFVGYGSVSGYEGTVGPATSPSSTSSIRRKDNSGNNTYGSNGSGWDSNDNSTNHYSQSSPVPLPVELASFTAIALDNKIRLEWRTETEVNNYGFEVQRAINIEQNNSMEWQNIGFVEGYGNTNSPKVYTFIDDKPSGVINIVYRLKQVDNDGRYEYSSIVEVSFIPNEFSLSQNYPNPFNPTTTIKYSIAQDSDVNIKVFDSIGNEINTLISEEQAAGSYEIEFNANDLASGMYFYRLQAGNFVQLKKMMLLK